MVDGVNQPGLFQRIGNFFGAGDPSAGQRMGTPFFPNDPNAGSATDPFANLSRSQRTMLGFAALRDAAASLEGRDSNFFQQSLGGFEQARERERLRAQGEYANRNQELMATMQLQWLARSSGSPELAAYAEQQLSRLMGGAALMPVDFAGGATPAGTAVPTGGAVSGDDFLRGMEERGQIGVDINGNLMPETATVVAPEQDAISRLQAKRAALIEQLRQADIGQGFGVNLGTSAINQDIADIDAQIATLTAEASVAARARETDTRLAPLLDDALGFLLNESGEVREIVAPLVGAAPFASAMLPGITMDDTRRGRLAMASIQEIGAIAAMNGVQEARASGFTGSLTDSDIALIQSTGGTFDIMQPAATARSLRRLQEALQGRAGGNADDDQALIDRYSR